MSAWATAQGLVPAEFFHHSHGVRTRDKCVSVPPWSRSFSPLFSRHSIKRWQTIPVPGSSLSEDELTAAANVIEATIAENGRLLAEAGKGGIYALPGVHKLISALRDGGARWGIVTSGKRREGGASTCATYES
jgi:sugar-phosphatase